MPASAATDRPRVIGLGVVTSDERPTVLVVDDDPEIRAFVSDVLEDEGYAVERAAHGAAALALMAGRHPDIPAVILLDMNMPVMDGPTFALAYSGTAVPHAPILCITAGTAVEHNCRAIGAEDFLGKPFDLDTLVHKVDRLARPAA